MFKKIFIVEHEKPDIELLVKGLYLASVKNDCIDIIDNIDNAYVRLRDKIQAGEKYAAIIDIYWTEHYKKKGLVLAKSIRKNMPSVKLVAFTRLGEKTNINDICENFDALIDKSTSSPHPFGILIDQIDIDFFEKLGKGHDFFAQPLHENEEPNSTLASRGGYFFEIKSEEKVSAQFVFADFSNFSLRDEDLQLKRFGDLQDSLRGMLQDLEFSDEKIVVLPTGDGVVIGIINAAVEPLAVRIAFGLLKHLRDHGLDKELRIGVHYGPVYHLIGEKGESQIIGPGINKAARVEAKSEPGRVLVSQEYFDMFLDRSSDPFCQELTIKDTIDIKVKKEPTFKAKFVAKGQIGAHTT